ncbi:MAG: hypothetical protein Q4G33_09960 [bacterium]|nr:hypothetical protein [bacterium]
MPTIEAAQELTIDAVPGETYAITYGWHYELDIFNNSDGDIQVNTDNDFTNGKYLTIPSESGYNGFCKTGEASSTVYIKSLGSGTISIALHRNR